MSESKGKRLKIEMETQMNVLDGCDSVETGVKVIFASAGGRTEGGRGAAEAWREGDPASQSVNVLCTLEKHV